MARRAELRVATAGGVRRQIPHGREASLVSSLFGAFVISGGGAVGSEGLGLVGCAGRICKLRRVGTLLRGSGYELTSYRVL